jgi:hypothetical protein
MDAPESGLDGARLRGGEEVTITCVCFMLTALLISPAYPADLEVVFQDSGPDWAERYIQVPVEQFSANRVRDVILNNLQSLQTHRLVKVVVATDRQDILHMRRGKSMADYSYQLWVNVLEERLRKVNPIAVALKIDGNAAFRFRNSTGTSTETALYGDSPFLVHGPTENAKILHVSFSRVLSGEGSVVQASFFLESLSPLSGPGPGNLALRLKRAVGISQQTVTIIRGDSWFIENEGFPIFYPFGSSHTPPTLQNYLCTPTVVCSDGEGELKCRTQKYRFGECR